MQAGQQQGRAGRAGHFPQCETVSQGETRSAKEGRALDVRPRGQQRTRDMHAARSTQHDSRAGLGWGKRSAATPARR